MKFFVGVTNSEWSEHLAAKQPDEVNLWQPRSQPDFRAIHVGAPFLFKLHGPLNFIAGCGIAPGHSGCSSARPWRYGKRSWWKACSPIVRGSDR